MVCRRAIRIAPFEAAPVRVIVLVVPHDAGCWPLRQDPATRNRLPAEREMVCLAEEVQSRPTSRVKGRTTGIRLARGVGRDMVELEYGKLRCVTLKWSKAL